MRLAKYLTGSESQVTLALIALNLDGSLSANCLRTCLAAKPKEHSPCRMGALKPDQRAFLSAPRLSINEIKTHHLTLNPREKKSRVQTRMSEDIFDGKRHPSRLGGSVDSHLPWQQSSGLYAAGSSLHSDGTRLPVTPGEDENCLDLYLIHKPLNFSYTHVG